MRCRTSSKVLPLRVVAGAEVALEFLVGEVVLVGDHAAAELLHASLVQDRGGPNLVLLMS